MEQWAGQATHFLLSSTNFYLHWQAVPTKIQLSASKHLLHAFESQEVHPVYLSAHDLQVFSSRQKASMHLLQLYPLIQVLQFQRQGVQVKTDSSRKKDSTQLEHCDAVTKQDEQGFLQGEQTFTSDSQMKTSLSLQILPMTMWLSRGSSMYKYPPVLESPALFSLLLYLPQLFPSNTHTQVFWPSQADSKGPLLCKSSSCVASTATRSVMVLSSNFNMVRYSDPSMIIASCDPSLENQTSTKVGASILCASEKSTGSNLFTSSTTNRYLFSSASLNPAIASLFSVGCQLIACTVKQTSTGVKSFYPIKRSPMKICVFPSHITAKDLESGEGDIFRKLQSSMWDKRICGPYQWLISPASDPKMRAFDFYVFVSASSVMGLALKS